MLVDPQGVDKAQGGVGLVTMLYFSADGKTMQVETYSTDKKAFFLEENQFTLTLDLAGDKKAEATTEQPEPETDPATEPEATTASAPEATNAPEQTNAPEPEKNGCGAISFAILPVLFLALPVVRKKRRA